MACPAPNPAFQKENITHSQTRGRWCDGLWLDGPGEHCLQINLLTLSTKVSKLHNVWLCNRNILEGSRQSLDLYPVWRTLKFIM